LWITAAFAIGGIPAERRDRVLSPSPTPRPRPLAATS
jgi:hypothetical protein